MIEAICNSLTKKIIKSVDGYDESKADEISYGLQLLIGEVPKFFITVFNTKYVFPSPAGK